MQPIIRGDVYLVSSLGAEHPVAKQLGASGPVFDLTERNTFFQYWSAKQRSQFWTEKSPFKHLEIRGETILEGSAGDNTIVGIFAPINVDKKVIADGVRRQFGLGAILLKAQCQGTDSNVRFLARVCRRNLECLGRGVDFEDIDDLISAVAKLFLQDNPTTDADRRRICEKIVGSMRIARHGGKDFLRV